MARLSHMGQSKYSQNTIITIVNFYLFIINTIHHVIALPRKTT
jgi:hypothetical protein